MFRESSKLLAQYEWNTGRRSEVRRREELGPISLSLSLSLACLSIP